MFYPNGSHKVAKIFWWTAQYMLAMKKRLEPNMLAIYVIKATQYACNLKSQTDHMYLQSLWTGIKYECNYPKFVLVRFGQKLQTGESRTISEIAMISGPYLNGFQSYIARFSFVLAIIFDAFCDQDCEDILSLSKKMQPYIVHPKRATNHL